MFERIFYKIRLVNEYFFLSKEHDIFNSKTTYKTFQQIILSNFSTSENKKKKYFE